MPQTLIMVVLILIGLAGILLYLGRWKKTGKWGWELPGLPGVEGGAKGVPITPFLLWLAFWVILYLDYESAWKFMWAHQPLFWSTQIAYPILVFGSKEKKDKDGKVIRPQYQWWLAFGVIDLVIMAILTAAQVPIPFMGGERTPSTKQAVTQTSAAQSASKTIPFTEGTIPQGVNFQWVVKKEDMERGCTVIVMYDGAPQEGISYDCAGDVKIGEDLRNLYLSFWSKETATPIVVTMTFTPH